jgi:hypothetical protein
MSPITQKPLPNNHRHQNRHRRIKECRSCCLPYVSSRHANQQLFGSSSDVSGEIACQASPLLPANSNDFMLSFTLKKQERGRRKTQTDMKKTASYVEASTRATFVIEETSALTKISWCHQKDGVNVI